MSLTGQKFLVAALSFALFCALIVVGGVDAKRRASQARAAASAAAAQATNPQLQRGRQVYVKYSCNACHGDRGAGGIKNLNAETGGEINGLLHLTETYTPAELDEQVRKGTSEVEKADPTGPDPPLHMPAYRDYIGGQEMKDLVAYLMSLQIEEPKSKKSEW
jgi:mono/diheme cytochrome c family protein